MSPAVVSINHLIEQARAASLAAQRDATEEDPALIERREQGELARMRLPAAFADMRASVLMARIPESFRVLAMTWSGYPNVLLMGPTGIGKTRALVALCRRLLRDGVRDGGSTWTLARGLSWRHVADLAAARRRWPMGKGEAPEVTEAMESTMLVLDELGGEQDTAAVREVLEARYASGLPTLATSGRTLTELGSHYGAAVVRRILECGGRQGAVCDAFPGDA